MIVNSLLCKIFPRPIACVQTAFGLVLISLRVSQIVIKERPFFAGSPYPDEWRRSSFTVNPCASYRKDENKTQQRANNYSQGVLFQFNAGSRPTLAKTRVLNYSPNSDHMATI